MANTIQAGPHWALEQQFGTAGSTSKSGTKRNQWLPPYWCRRKHRTSSLPPPMLQEWKRRRQSKAISVQKKNKERRETQSRACCHCLKHRWDLNSNNPQKLSSSGHQLTSWLIPVRINAWNYYAWQIFAEWELVKNTQDEDQQEVKVQTSTSEILEIINSCSNTIIISLIFHFLFNSQGL